MSDFLESVPEFRDYVIITDKNDLKISESEFKKNFEYKVREYLQRGYVPVGGCTYNFQFMNKSDFSPVLVISQVVVSRTPHFRL
jgi:hypothetical protein